MNMTPLVTILIPTYKRANYLREAIRSALAQTYSNLEFLVLDDASPDNTSDVVAEFAQEQRLRYVRHEKNVGIAGNWRIGIEHAKGDFFCLLHDDDTFEPQFVEKLLQPLLSDDNLVLSFCDHWVMNDVGERLVKETEALSAQFKRGALQTGPLPDFARSALINASIGVGATLFRRSQVNSEFINEAAKGSIDMWLFYQCVKTGGGAYYHAERLMNYRVHGGGMSASAPMYMGEGHLFRHRRILNDPAMKSIHAETRIKLANTLTNYGINLMASGQHAAARSVLSEALKLRPHFRTVAAFALACGGTIGMGVTAAVRQRRNHHTI